MTDEDLTTDMETLRFRLRERARAFAASRAKPKDPPDLWRRYLKAVKQQMVHLARAGRIEITRKGQPVDPNDFKGVVRLRLPMKE